MTTKTKVGYDNRTPADRARLDAAVRRVLAEATRWLAVRDLAAALGLDAGDRHDALMVSKAAGRLVALGQARRRGDRALAEYACLGPIAAVTRQAIVIESGATVARARERVVATMGPDDAPGAWRVTSARDEAMGVSGALLRFPREEAS